MENKKALITGASEGIGRALAHKLAAEGYAITAVARNEERLHELVRELGGEDKHRSMVFDLRQSKSIHRLSEEIDKGGYDLLVNNAGFGVYGQFEEVHLDKLQGIARVNCDAVVELSHAFLKRAKRGDSLINVASALGFTACPNSAMYAATKAFVVSLSEALWYEQKPRGVYVMALCPGLTDTKFHETAGGTGANHPPRALYQTAEEVAAETFRHLQARTSPTVVTGLMNGMMLFSARMLSRKALVRMIGKFAPRDKAATQSS